MTNNFKPIQMHPLDSTVGRLQASVEDSIDAAEDVMRKMAQAHIATIDALKNAEFYEDVMQIIKKLERQPTFMDLTPIIDELKEYAKTKSGKGQKV